MDLIDNLIGGVMSKEEKSFHGEAKSNQELLKIEEFSNLNKYSRYFKNNSGFSEDERQERITKKNEMYLDMRKCFEELNDFSPT